MAKSAKPKPGPKPKPGRKPRTTLTVTHVGWKVGDRTFPTRARAIDYARRQALKIERAGGLSQVRVQGRDGKFQIEWTYPRSSDPRRHKG